MHRRLMWTIFLLLGAGMSCAAQQQAKEKKLDEVLSGVSDQKMRETWKKAESEGKLPSLDSIPTPDRRVKRRQPVPVQEPTRQLRRPVIPPGTRVEARLFSEKPISRYVGPFKVTKNEPGILVGTIKDQKEPLELFYAIPATGKRLAIPERAQLQLDLKDEVVDEALQRRVLLRSEDGTTPFAYLAEGGDTPFKLRVESMNLEIEQASTEGNPEVTVRYGGTTIVLKQGGSQRIGSGPSAVEVFLRESIGRSAQQTMLSEGQRYYVNIVMYRPQ